MPKIMMELTENEIREAVSEWATRNHGISVAPENVVAEAVLDWDLCVYMERGYYKVKVSFEADMGNTP